MPRPPTDKALRRFVTEIAQATPDDIEAILAHLDPAHRARAQALLAEFSAAPGAKDSLAAPGERPGPRGLSPWLEARILAAGDPDKVRSAAQRPFLATAPKGTIAAFIMTGEALKALQEVALAAAPGAPGAGSVRLVEWASGWGRRYLRPGARP